MNITLVYPLLPRKRSIIDENKQFWPPLGLAYIAAILEKRGHVVHIIDRDLLLRKNDMDFTKTDDVMIGMIKDFGSSIIGISATTPNMSDVKHVSRLIKNRISGSTVIVGGPHPTGEPMLTLKESPSVDIVALGEGEFTMGDIADGLPQDKIAGIAYRNGDRIISNARREPIKNLDDLPFPARHLLDMKFYTRPSRFTSRNLSLKTTSIFTARGCPYRCNFCAGPLVFGGKVRFHSAKRVIGEIEELISKYSIEALYFAEDMFLSSKIRAEEILNLFIERKINKQIKWMAQAKANIITPSLLRLMKEAGCVGIEYGFESGSQRVLDLMNKKLKVEESVKAAELTRKESLRFQANIIVGYPGETEKDFRETMKFIKKIKPNMIGFNLFMPLPGTASYEKLKAEGRELPGWDDVGNAEAPQVNFADMPPAVFEKLYLESRLKIILPMNLRCFIADNINNPLRMVKIALTQFNGVLVKTIRSFCKLRSLKKKAGSRKRVLFLSYNGLLEPILPSQAIPYLNELSRKGFEFELLTYEKKRDLDKSGVKRIAEIKSDLKSGGINWHYLRYHKRPRFLSTIFDILSGAALTLWLITTRKISIVHIRGITPGMIMIFLSKLVRVRILFDMRGLLAEEYVGGGLWKEDSLSFKLVKNAEKNLLKRADAVTVLTNKHLELNKRLEYLKDREIPIDVIPCCVDMGRFYSDIKKASAFKKDLGIVGKTVLMYPGKIGSFYFINEMLDFFKEVVRVIPDSVFLILTHDEEAMILNRSSAIGISDDKIKVIKDVSFEEMPGYYRLADAGLFFINPYKKIGSSPIKMGEFLASGVPVVINPGIGDTAEIVSENRVGVIVESFKEASYRKAISELLRLKEEGEMLRTRCRDTAKKRLSLDEGVDKYYRIYEKLAGKK